MPLDTKPHLSRSTAFSIGEHTGWSLHDGIFQMPAEAMARGVPLAELRAASGDAISPDDKIELQVNVMLLRWTNKVVLIDAGCGTAFGPNLGFAGETLSSLGIAPQDLHAIVFTHLHLDHVAGALDLVSRTLRYPGTRLLALRDEVRFWQQPVPDLSGTALDPERRSAVVRGMHDALEIASPHLEFFSANDTLFPGFTAIALPGHTPFHTGFLLESQGVRVLNAGDAFIDPRIHGVHPEYSPISDALPDVGRATRRNTLERGRQESWQIFGAHFPVPGFL
jgi:glyoxylase-like metal-dependent hydrolase (beta-lactamase superfamily II)